MGLLRILYTRNSYISNINPKLQTGYFRPGCLSQEGETWLKSLKKPNDSSKSMWKWLRDKFNCNILQYILMKLLHILYIRDTLDLVSLARRLRLGLKTKWKSQNVIYMHRNKMSRAMHPTQKWTNKILVPIIKNLWSETESPHRKTWEHHNSNLIIHYRKCLRAGFSSRGGFTKYALWRVPIIFKAEKKNCSKMFYSLKKHKKQQNPIPVCLASNDHSLLVMCLFV